MEKKNQMQEILRLEREIREKLEALKENISAEIEAIPPQEGVTAITDSPRCAIVSLSTLAKNGCNLTATMYIQKCQADAVGRKLASATSVTAFLKMLDEMVATQRVKIGNETICLNEETLTVIREFLVINAPDGDESREEDAPC